MLIRLGLLIFLLPAISSGQTRVALKGGLNQARFFYRPQYDGDGKGSGNLLTRFNAGFLIEIPLNDENWFLYTGPIYYGKGNRIKHLRLNFDTIVTKLKYVELPLYVGYKFQQGQRNKITTGAGIFGAYGFGGKVLYHNDPEQTQVHLHRKNNSYKRIDFGFGFNTGYEFNNSYGLKIEYSRSLFDISKYEHKKTNNVFSFSFYWYLPSFNKPKNGTPRF